MSTSTQKVKLQASDGEEFEVDRQVAERSILIKNLLDDIPDASTSGEAIPIMNASNAPLYKLDDRSLTLP